MRGVFHIASLSLALCVVPGSPFAARPGPQAKLGSGAGTTLWQSPARLRHVISKTSGTLEINDRGVEFRPNKGSPLRWPYTEIRSFRLEANRLDLETYQNRGWHRSGDRAFHFRLTDPVPPSVAEALARRVQKPVENGRPDPDASCFASLPARHRTFGGGTNGALCFRDGGIDYVTSGGRGGRSWRWADIETIAHPGPYHFRMQGYRETFEFELKQPMSRKLFDRLWDAVYSRDLKGLAYSEGRQQ
ncbi:MAG TPA: hypothetical protein VFQ24_04915 [Terriglobia bacterium]|nr:hypothetical protein [Terriglobia bacterium]